MTGKIYFLSAGGAAEGEKLHGVPLKAVREAGQFAH